MKMVDRSCWWFFFFSCALFFSPRLSLELVDSGSFISFLSHWWSCLAIFLFSLFFESARVFSHVSLVSMIGIGIVHRSTSTALVLFSSLLSHWASSSSYFQQVYHHPPCPWCPRLRLRSNDFFSPAVALFSFFFIPSMLFHQLLSKFFFIPFPSMFTSSPSIHPSSDHCYDDPHRTALYTLTHGWFLVCIFVLWHHEKGGSLKWFGQYFSPHHDERKTNCDFILYLQPEIQIHQKCCTFTLAIDPAIDTAFKFSFRQQYQESIHPFSSTDSCLLDKHSTAWYLFFFVSFFVFVPLFLSLHYRHTKYVPVPVLFLSVLSYNNYYLSYLSILFLFLVVYHIYKSAQDSSLSSSIHPSFTIHISIF